MSAAECLACLGSVTTGRPAVTHRALPCVVPVRIGVVDDEVVVESCLGGLVPQAHALDERDREAAGLLGRRFGLPSSGRKEAMTRSSFDPLVKTPKQTVRVRFGTMTIGSRKRPFVPVLRACSRTRKMILGPL